MRSLNTQKQKTMPRERIYIPVAIMRFPVKVMKSGIVKTCIKPTQLWEKQ